MQCDTELGPVPRLRRTPGLLIGPYYPVQQPAKAGTHLFHGQQPPQGARRLVLEGCCRSENGEPVAGVLVELWHADPFGRYRHASAPEEQAVVEGFTGYGRARTDAGGVFAFRSLVPGGYVDRNTTRAPHLHVQLTGRVDRLATQLFLPGERANEADRWFAALAHPELLVPRVLSGTPDSLHLAWTAVLGRG
jgi:protocatechuate 3,4-dioxygenase, beta subunit